VCGSSGLFRLSQRECCRTASSFLREPRLVPLFFSATKSNRAGIVLAGCHRTPSHIKAPPLRDVHLRHWSGRTVSGVVTIPTRRCVRGQVQAHRGGPCRVRGAQRRGTRGATEARTRGQQRRQPRSVAAVGWTNRRVWRRNGKSRAAAPASATARLCDNSQAKGGGEQNTSKHRTK